MKLKKWQISVLGVNFSVLGDTHIMLPFHLILTRQPIIIVKIYLRDKGCFQIHLTNHYMLAIKWHNKLEVNTSMYRWALKLFNILTNLVSCILVIWMMSAPSTHVSTLDKVEDLLTALDMDSHLPYFCLQVSTYQTRIYFLFLFYSLRLYSTSAEGL